MIDDKMKRSSSYGSILYNNPKNRKLRHSLDDHICIEINNNQLAENNTSTDNNTNNTIQPILDHGVLSTSREIYDSKNVENSTNLSEIKPTRNMRRKETSELVEFNLSITSKLTEKYKLNKSQEIQKT